MPPPSKTGFDRFFDEQMSQPSFANEYEQARAEVDAVDQIVRSLNEAREHLGMTKADLARAICAKPEIVRRLFTAQSPNPTLSTVVKVAAALGYRLEVVPSAQTMDEQDGVPQARSHHPKAHSRTLRGTRALHSSPNRRTSA